KAKSPMPRESPSGRVLQINQRCLEVDQLEVGDPLEWHVAGLGGAFPLATHLESENVVSRLAQELAIRHACPAVGAELQPEEQNPLARLRRLQITSLQRQAVGRRDGNLLRPRHRLSEGKNEERIFLEDANDERHIGGQDVNM